MADYKTIHGINIRDYTTDPDTLITGQVWYDTTNKVLQFQATGAGAWSTTNNLNTARDQIAGAGTTTSGLVFGENFGGETESFNGTSYTEQNDLNTSRRALAGAGASNTAALAFGGNEIHSGPNAAADNTESFNGTSWTELADLNQARSFTVGC